MDKAAGFNVVCLPFLIFFPFALGGGLLDVTDRELILIALGAGILINPSGDVICRRRVGGEANR